MARDSCENPVYLVPQVRQVIESAKPPMPKLTLTRSERSAFRFSANPSAKEAVEISTKSVPGDKLVSSVASASTAAPETSSSTKWWLGLAACAGLYLMRRK